MILVEECKGTKRSTQCSISVTFHGIVDRSCQPSIVVSHCPTPILILTPFSHASVFFSGAIASRFHRTLFSRDRQRHRNTLASSSLRSIGSSWHRFPTMRARMEPIIGSDEIIAVQRASHQASRCDVAFSREPKEKEREREREYLNAR